MLLSGERSEAERVRWSNGLAQDLTRGSPSVGAPTAEDDAEMVDGFGHAGVWEAQARVPEWGRAKVGKVGSLTVRLVGTGTDGTDRVCRRTGRAGKATGGRPRTGDVRLRTKGATGPDGAGLARRALVVLVEGNGETEGRPRRAWEVTVRPGSGGEETLPRGGEGGRAPGLT